MGNVTRSELDCHGYTTIRLNQDLFALDSSKTRNFIHYTNFLENDMSHKNERIRLQNPKPRKQFSLAIYDQRFIFVIGGGQLNLTTWYQYEAEKLHRCVYFHDIMMNTWHKAPSLVETRIKHSSCVLGFYIYTFCGQYEKSTYRNSIERIDAD